MAIEFTIDITPLAREHLKELTAYNQRQISDKIKEQLSHDPVKTTRNKKLLTGKKPPWKGKTPFWELRVGEYRVFYDVDEDAHEIFVRDIRHKPPHSTMEEVL